MLNISILLFTNQPQSLVNLPLLFIFIILQLLQPSISGVFVTDTSDHFQTATLIIEKKNTKSRNLFTENSMQKNTSVFNKNIYMFLNENIFIGNFI